MHVTTEWNKTLESNTRKGRGEGRYSALDTIHIENEQKKNPLQLWITKYFSTCVYIHTIYHCT